VLGLDVTLLVSLSCVFQLKCSRSRASDGPQSVCVTVLNFEQDG